MHEPSAIRTISVSRIPLPVEYKLISSCDFVQKQSALCYYIENLPKFLKMH